MVNIEHPTSQRGVRYQERLKTAMAGAADAIGLLLVGLVLMLAGCAYRGDKPDHTSPPWPRPLDETQ